MSSAWIQTQSGQQFFPFDPFRNEYRIEDIAHALGNICRFAGHTKEFYSVAQHCVLVSENVLPEFSRWGLLHDAAEAYFGDLPSPIKSIMPEYHAVEHQTAVLIADAFGITLDPEMELAVKMVDRLVFWAEVAQLMQPVHPDLRHQMKEVGVGDQGPDIKITPLAPAQASALFLNRFQELWPDKNKESRDEDALGFMENQNRT